MAEKDNLNSTENLHKNHRQRLKQRFIDEGLQNFEPHNVLELLLFYAIPRRDTNDLAHRLISRFGSLSSVFDANYEQLLEFDSIGQNAAVLIKLIPQLSRRYLLDKQTRFSRCSNLEQVGEYLVNHFIGATCESVLMVLFNNRMEIIGCVTIHVGSLNSSNVNLRLIAETGFKHHAASFILAHNHPDGDTEPSEDDIQLTYTVKRMFEGLDMPMLDHIIVADDKWLSVLTEESLALESEIQSLT